MRGLHGGALQAAVPVVTGGLHGQSCVSHTVAVPSSRSAAPLSLRVSTEMVVVKEGKRAVKFRPCIDIHKGKVKQIVGSTLRDLPDDKNSENAVSLVTNFEAQLSAGEFAEMYKNDDLQGGHVIMLGADPDSHAAALEALKAYPGGLQVGGGVNLDNASGYLDAGASHVIVTSFVFRDGKMDDERLKQLVKLTGKSRLVLDLSCRKKDGHYMVVTDRWQRFSDLVVNEATLAMLSASADEFLVHGVDVEGKRLGIDDELVSILGKYSPIPVTYAGGVNTLADLERIKAAGNGVVDVTVGSALDVFGGDLPYTEVVAWHNRQACATFTDRSSMAMAALHLSTASVGNHALATGSGAVKFQCASGNGNVVVRAFEVKDRVSGGLLFKESQLWRTKESGLVVRRSAESASVEVATAGGVTEVDKDTFWPFVKDAAEKVVVLDMYTQWCGPCKLMLPKVIALSATYDDVVFAKLDCNQDNKLLAKELGVKTVPTFKIFKNAVVVAEIRGAKYDDLVSAIERARSSS